MDKSEQDPPSATVSHGIPAPSADAAGRYDAQRSSPPLTKLERPVLPPARADIEDGGPTGPEPTRFGDWERKGRVSDF